VSHGTLNEGFRCRFFNPFLLEHIKIILKKLKKFPKLKKISEAKIKAKLKFNYAVVCAFLILRSIRALRALPRDHLVIFKRYSAIGNLDKKKEI
jgi:hypothetical protein